MNEVSYHWTEPSCPQAVLCISNRVILCSDEGLTEEETGPSWADTPLAVKLTPLGALSLTSRAAGAMSANALEGQLVFPTCGSVVEVLVDKLERIRISNGPIVKLGVGSPNIRRWRPWRCR
jgi:hypothetical protein